MSCQQYVNYRMSRVDVKLLHLNLPLNVPDTLLSEDLDPLQDNLEDPVLENVDPCFRGWHWYNIRMSMRQVWYIFKPKIPILVNFGWYLLQWNMSVNSMFIWEIDFFTHIWRCLPAIGRNLFNLFGTAIQGRSGSGSGPSPNGGLVFGLGPLA
jgi:hypothetical protein